MLFPPVIHFSFLLTAWMTPRGEGTRAEIATEVTASSGAEDQAPLPKMEHQRTKENTRIEGNARETAGCKWVCLFSQIRIWTHLRLTSVHLACHYIVVFLLIVHKHIQMQG